MMRRLGVGALMVVMSLMLAVTVAACRSSADSKATPSGWRDFQIAPAKGEQHPVESIEEMERIGGFPFAFPSYVPQCMDQKITLIAWAHVAPEYKSQGETIGIDGNHPDCPDIDVTEQVDSSHPDTGSTSTIPPGTLGVAPVDSQEITIADVVVRCGPPFWASEFAPLGVSLECSWSVEDREFTVSFRWFTGGSDLTLTDDMRQEAMKVVESMIVAPEHP